MTNNREIKIAVVVAAIMLTVCFVIVVSNVSSKNSTQETSEIKVYKHYDDGETKEYRECKITTDDLIDINSEFSNIMLLDDSYKYPGASINGTYRITKGTDYIAFDGNNALVYRGDMQALYIYESDLYQKVADLCQ